MADRSIPFNPGRIVVTVHGSTAATHERAHTLAQQLQFELMLPDQVPRDALRLVVTDRRVELRALADAREGPVYVDFCGRSARFGRGTLHHGKELIARAVGLKDQFPFVVDATAGFAGDAMVLARLGCRVHAIERSAAVAVLVQDGILRACAAHRPGLDAALARLTLEVADAREVLTCVSDRSRHDRPAAYVRPDRLEPAASLASGTNGTYTTLEARPDVVYLDPMYPSSDKSALNRKELRALRELVGDDTDSLELFDIARRAARRRVVVKRPRHAPALAPHPDIQFKGSSIRFDVYLVNEATTEHTKGRCVERG